MEENQFGLLNLIFFAPGAMGPCHPTTMTSSKVHYTMSTAYKSYASLISKSINEDAGTVVLAEGECMKGYLTFQLIEQLKKQFQKDEVKLEFGINFAKEKGVYYLDIVIDVPKKVNYDEAECAICLDAEPNCTIKPCGHRVACYKCLRKVLKANQQAQCPMCRGKIEKCVMKS